MEAQTGSIAIIDSDESVASNLAKTIKSDFDLSCFAFKTVRDPSLHMAKRETVLSVCSVILPDGTCRDLIDNHPDVDFVVTKSVQEPDPSILGLENSTLITKPFDMTKLNQVLTQALKLKTHDGLSSLFEIFENTNLRFRKSAEVIELTNTEAQIFKSLLEANGKIVSRDNLSMEISNEKWRYGDRKFDVHISSVRKKINQLTNGTVTIKTVRSKGYKIT